MVDIEGLQKLAQTSRDRKNLDKVHTAINEVDEHREALEEWLDAADEICDALSKFTEKTGEVDADLMHDGEQAKLLSLAEQFDRYIPHEDSMLAALPENIDTVRSELGELENMLENRANYSAEERDEKWEEIIGALNDVATGLDELSVLGVQLEPSNEG
ncbi:hypothetical protein [Streptomyces tubercidicus]|uniref:hypothetical protein n=1 Tax=Streptomyces tubercidicus TaxID=47759 RepID=UPI0036B3FBE5